MTETEPQLQVYLGPPTRGQALLYRVVRNALVAFCRLYWRLEVHGLANVPDGPFILSAVHRSNIDTPVVAAVTTRRLRYLGKVEMWKFRASAWFFSNMGGVPVHRGSPDRDALRSIQTMLEGGEPVVIFPEGTRRFGPVVEEVYDGPAFLSGRTGAPILPVGIGGSEAAMRRGTKFLYPVKVTMVIGEPIAAPVGPEGKRPSRRQVREATEDLRTTIQELFDQAQRLAGRL